MTPRTVTFVDTSILLEILKVPGKHQQADAIREELRARTANGESLLLPAAAIIETGNHIAQVPDGDQRRAAAIRFSHVLRATVDETAPWRLNSAQWDGALLSAINGGVRGSPSLIEMASAEIGAGDLSILAEAAAYADRVAHVEVRIWTLDAKLLAWT